MKTKILSKAILGAGLATAVLVAMGCARTPVRADSGAIDFERRAAELEKRETKLGERQAALQKLESQLGAREASLMKQQAELKEHMRSQQSVTTVTAKGETLLPPKAEPGQCFARVIIPPKYETKTERLMNREATERIEIIPAKYETVTERVLVEEASERLEVIPPTYGWVEERILVRPVSTKLVTTPPVYETVTERILVSPARTEWKKGTGPIQKIDKATGEILCLVEIPAVYKTVTKQVLKTPASTKTVEIPAVYKTVKKRVMKTPPQTRTIKIPAKFKTVNVTKLVEPAREKRIQIPGGYVNVTKHMRVTEEQVAWREILCETNITPGKIRELQAALKHAGFNPGPIDGVLGTNTMKAVNAYQRAKGLPVDQYLNVRTVKALGVKPGR